jgi:CRISPR-associated protein Cmr4
MFKDSRIMFIYTESSLHCGSGTGLGVIDLPIQRERYTQYPVCQASGIKGVIREWFENKYGSNDSKVKYTFGPDFERDEGEAHAGAVTFTDGKILLFPVRSMNEVFAYTTCPFVLNRFKRDLEMAGVKVEWNIPVADQDNRALGTKESRIASDNKVVLEEYTFDFKVDDEVTKITHWLSEKAFPQSPEYGFWRDKIKKDLLVLSDNAFGDFVRLSTEVQARIRIKDDTKTVAKGALFYEESLPPDTLLYSVVLTHDPACDTNGRPDGLKDSKEVMDYVCNIHKQRLLFGGDTTVGKGIVYVNFLGGDQK